MAASPGSYPSDRSLVHEYLRAVLGDGARPPRGRALMDALALPLAASGLLLQQPITDGQPLIARGGNPGGHHLLLLFALGDVPSADQPGGARAALIAALTALAAAHCQFRGLPVAVTLIGEPDRACGSPSLEGLSLPTVAACLWDGGGYDDDRPWLALGSHGLIRARLTARQAGGSLGLGAVVPNAAWQLIWALAALKSPAEAINLAGFYDDVREPEVAELEVITQAAGELVHRVRQAGGSLLGLTDQQLGLVRAFSPAVSVTGMGVEQQPGRLPTTAWAELAMSLVPRQSPEAIITALRQHASRHGLAEVDVEVQAAYAGWETAAASSFVGHARCRLAEVIGSEVAIRPFADEPAPLAWLLHTPGIPAIGFGPGQASWPILLDRVEQLSAWLVMLLQNLATASEVA